MRLTWGLVAVLVMGTATPSLALEGPETSVGIRVGLGSFTSYGGFGPTTEIKDPMVLGVTAGIRRGPLGIEISAEKTKLDMVTDIKEATVTMIPILFTPQIHWEKADAPISEILAAPLDNYIGAGVGYYINSAKAGSEAQEASGFTDYKVTAKNSVGLHLAVGTNIKVSSAVAIALDARYFFADADLTVKGGGISNTHPTGLIGFVLTAGLKYIFPK